MLTLVTFVLMLTFTLTRVRTAGGAGSGGGGGNAGDFGLMLLLTRNYSKDVVPLDHDTF